MPKKTLLTFVPAYRPLFRGAEISLENLLTYLSPSFNIHVITAQKNPSPDVTTPEGIKIYYNRIKPMVDYWIESIKPDILFSQLEWNRFIWNSKVSKNIPKFIYIHSVPELNGALPEVYNREDINLILNTHQLYNVALKQIPEDRLSLLYPPILPCFKRWNTSGLKDKHPFTCTLIGTHKGLDLLIEIAKRLPDVHFIAVGECKYPLPTNIELQEPTEELYKIYQRTDALLHLAMLESFGMVIKEAIFNGIPIIYDNPLPGVEEALFGTKKETNLTMKPVDRIINNILLCRQNYNDEVDKLKPVARYIKKTESQQLNSLEEKMRNKRIPEVQYLTTPAVEPKIDIDDILERALECKIAILVTGAPGQINSSTAIATELDIPIVDSIKKAELLLDMGVDVIANGWYSNYTSLLNKKGKPRLIWHSGWAGTDLMEEGTGLTACLDLLQHGLTELYWLELRDVLPKGAQYLAPVWSHPEPINVVNEKMHNHVVVGLHGRFPTKPKNILAAIIGCSTIENIVLHIGDSSLATGNSSLVLYRILNNVNKIIHPTLTREETIELLSAVDLLVHPSTSETWPGMALESIYAGTPVVSTNAVAWMKWLYPSAKLLCCLDCSTSTKELHDKVEFLLGSPETRRYVLEEQLRCIETIRPIFLKATKDVIFNRDRIFTNNLYATVERTMKNV